MVIAKMKPMITAALVAALAIPSVTQAACQHLKLGKTYEGVGFGYVGGVPNSYIACQVRFSRQSGRYVYLDPRRSYCKGTAALGPGPGIYAAPASTKMTLNGRIATKGCKIVRRSNALVQGTMVSRSKGVIDRKGIRLTLTDVGFWMRVHR